MHGLVHSDGRSVRHEVEQQIPQFVSPVPDHRAIGVDAMSMDWSARTAYAYPPSALIPRILLKIREDRSRLVLIVEAKWFAPLLDFLV